MLSKSSYRNKTLVSLAGGGVVGRCQPSDGNCLKLSQLKQAIRHSSWGGLCSVTQPHGGIKVWISLSNSGQLWIILYSESLTVSAKIWLKRWHLCSTSTSADPKGSDLLDREPEELWTEIHDIVQEAVIKTIISQKRNAKRQNGCLSSVENRWEKRSKSLS